MTLGGACVCAVAAPGDRLVFYVCMQNHHGFHGIAVGSDPSYIYAVPQNPHEHSRRDFTVVDGHHGCDHRVTEPVVVERKACVQARKSRGFVSVVVWRVRIRAHLKKLMFASHSGSIRRATVDREPIGRLRSVRCRVVLVLGVRVRIGTQPR